MYVCHFTHGGDTFPLGIWSLFREALVCKKITPKLVPIRPKKLPQHVGALSCHHAKFHDFQACFGITGFKKPSCQSFRPSHDAQMFEFTPISCMGPGNSPKDTHVFSDNFDALEPVLVV